MAINRTRDRILIKSLIVFRDGGGKWRTGDEFYGCWWKIQGRRTSSPFCTRNTLVPFIVEHFQKIIIVRRVRSCSIVQSEGK